jgi:small-conductance mechanosensitive channel/CRP-like cAMP-binding protein
MSLFSTALGEAVRAQTVFAAGALVGARVFSRVLSGTQASDGRRRYPLLVVLFVGHLACVITATFALPLGTSNLAIARIGALLLASFLYVGAFGLFLFDGLLPRLGVRAPAILRDLTVALGGAIAAIVTAKFAGVDVSGLFATSAVLTAVIGFAMQDTIGNLVSGLALQLDNSLRVGDWVQIGDRQGWITEISWRYTAFETRDWETVLIPNSQLTKAQVTILGRRAGKTQQVRRGVRFQVDFRWSPSFVIQTVQTALRATPMRLVSRDPAPCVECDELRDGVATYVVFYWLTDLTDVVDTDLRERIFTALDRAGVSLAVPQQAVAATLEDEWTTARRKTEDRASRLSVISKTELFQPLDDGERITLADRLVIARFAPGEVLTRQGEATVSLFVVVSGTLSVRVMEGGLEREVAQLGAGDFFGEMSLLTGKPRTATVVARSEAITYRLDREAAEELLKRRPQLAESLATILAQRRTGLKAARDGLDAEARAKQLDATTGDLLGRIRAAFRLTQSRPLEIDS